MTYRRSKVQRTIIDKLHGVDYPIGALEPGCDIFAFSKGQISLIDLITEVLDQIGPAEVVISTWTAAQRAIDESFRLLHDHRITTIRWLVDFSFLRRQPAYCQRLRERFGDDCIRVTKNHAKFILFKAGDWRIVLRTSMNLNQNPRFECWELSDDPAMYEFVSGIIERVFSEQPSEDTFKLRPGEHMQKFQDFGTNPNADSDTSHLGIDPNDLSD